MSVLRNSVLNGAHQARREGIVGPYLFVDLLNRTREKHKALVFLAERQPGNIFEQKGSRLRITKNAQVGRERVGTGIVQPFGISVPPVSRFAEGLARGA